MALLENELAFPRQKPTEETKRLTDMPDLRAVPAFDVENLTQRLEIHISDPQRVAFLVGLAETLPVDCVPELAKLATSDDSYDLETAAILAPELLKRGVESNLLDADSLDAIRDILGRLMSHEDTEVNSAAQAEFHREAARLQARDITTYTRIGWLAGRETKPGWRTADDIALKAMTGRTRQRQYRYDNQGRIIGVIA